jgi:aminoglycoside phosphotransferase
MGAADFLKYLPEAWSHALASSELAPITTGMSSAEVYRVHERDTPERFLKFARGDAAAALGREIECTKWLYSHSIRVPLVLMSFASADVAAAILSLLPGAQLTESGCAPVAAVRAIARGLRRLHDLPVTDCPFDESTQVRLLRAREVIERGLVDGCEFDSRNRALSPHALYARVAAAVPAPEDTVVVHGDATLDNILIDSLGEVGFIDCGRCGRGDRYVDLAIVTEQIEADLGQDLVREFLSCYGELQWDAAKAAFFRDLYEFF